MTLSGKLNMIPIIFIIVIAWAATGCFPSMLNRNVVVSKSSRMVGVNRVAVITRINVHLPREVRSKYMGRLKRSVANAIYNSGAFDQVYLYDAPPKRNATEHRVFVDVSLEPNYKSEFDWFVTWPAIYPMSCYWPIQHKKGVMHVKAITRLYDEKGDISKLEVKASKPFDIYIYGFVRTGPMEVSLQTAYQKVLQNLSESMGAVDIDRKKTKPSSIKESIKESKDKS